MHFPDRDCLADTRPVSTMLPMTLSPTGPTRDDYEIREMPFEEWADVDTLVHRAAVSSGDFDYMVRPLCPECGTVLALEYDEVEEGASILAELVCDACRVIWQLAASDDATL